MVTLQFPIRSTGYRLAKVPTQKTGQVHIDIGEDARDRWSIIC